VRGAVVGGQGAEKGELGNVGPFGDHLGAEGEVEVTFAEARENGLKVPFGAGGIAFHARDPGAGQRLVEFIFHFFGARSQEVQVFAIALFAAVRDALGVVAVVTKEAFVPAVEGKGDGAVGALDALAAGAATDEAGEAAAVEEEHGLLIES